MNYLHNNMKETFSDCLEMVEKKNADYGADEDPFANFRNAEVVGVSVERAILVRMMDKMSRASTLLDKEARVEDEKLDDTLEDLINYTAILKAYLNQE